MKHSKLIGVVGALAVGFFGSVAAVAGQTTQPAGAGVGLTIGSPAPAMSVKKWLKGTPVNELDSSKTYVVEFWATWCGPCVQSIPHLTEIAKKNTDVTFVGVSIWEDDTEQLPKFVEKMGDKMDYSVGYSGNQEGMSVTWMKAAAQNGIPTAFVVKEGKVVWIGHPMSLEEPLTQIKAGTFDVAAYKVAFEKEIENNRKEMAAQQALADVEKTFDQGDPEKAKEMLTKLVAEHPRFKEIDARIRFGWLAVEDPKGWDAKASEMAAGKKKDEVQRLTYFALTKAGKTEFSEQSRKAIELAMAALPEDVNILQYARAYFQRTKETDKQLEVVKRLQTEMAKVTDSNADAFKESLAKERIDLEAKVAASGSGH